MGLISVDPKQLLQTASHVKQQILSTEARNIANADARGAMRITQSVVSKGGLGIMAGSQTVHIDEPLNRSLRLANGDEAYWKTIRDTYTTFLNQFGTKGNPHSIDKLCQDLSNDLTILGAANSPDKITTIISSLQKKLAQFADMQQSIVQMRTDIDGQKYNLIHADGGVNGLITTIAALNHADRSPDEDMQLNTALFDLSQIMSVTREEGRGPESDFFTLKVGSFNANLQKLIEHSTTTPLTYQMTAGPTPGVPLNTLMMNGVDIEPQMTTGQLAGLIKADKNLQNIQAVLDNFAGVLRTKLNEIHNLGTSLTPPSTLTGSIGMFGSEGTAILGTNVISGQGTWRIALLNPADMNKIVDYVDVPLLQNETVAAFMARVNALPTAYASGNTVTLSLTPSGQLQLASSNPAFGVSVGSAGAVDAVMSTGVIFNAAQSTNVSHFFHLNDLMRVSSTSPNGIFGSLTLNSAIASNPQLFSGCKLYSAAAPPPPGTVGITQTPSQGNNVFQILGSFFTNTLTIPTAGDVPGRSTSLLNYAISFETFYSDQQQFADRFFKVKTDQLKTLQKEFQTTSGVDPQKARRDLMETGRSISLNTSTLAMLMKLEDQILKILTNGI